MNVDTELNGWSRAWQSYAMGSRLADLEATDLRDRVAREIYRTRLAMAGSILVTVIAGGGTLLAALTHGRAADIALAAGVWSFLAVVWLSTLWIARGTWRPLTETTDGFLRFSIRQCRSIIAGARLGAVLYTIGFVGIFAWKYRYLSMRPHDLLTSWPVALFVAVVTPAVFCMLYLLVGKKRAELARLLDALHQLDEAPAE